jgi:endonuclease/exonuclease/phosphatase family metal-dependent hydrolase
MLPGVRRRAGSSLQGLFAALLAVAGGACGGGPAVPGRRITVLTWNLYLGSDLMPLALVTSPDGVPAAGATLWANAQANDFPARAKLLADRITAAAPDLVALQEVSLYRRQVPGDYSAANPTPNATEVALDYLATLMAEIDARGGGYVVASTSANADSEFPVSDGAGGLFDLRLTDRDVILARTGVTTSQAVQTPFQAKFNLIVGGAGGVPVAFSRSVSRVDADVDGARFAFITSHLEVGALSVVQLAQAKELMADVSAVTGPAVLIGDFNSAPGMLSYPLLTKTFQDLAVKLGAPATDVTCCQAGDLKNAASQAGERIDLVLTRGPFRMKSARVLGTDPVVDRTPGGLWASDHFGVFAELELAQ